MTLSPGDAFVFYVLVFLAVVLAAWFIALWNARRAAQRHTSRIPCASCGKPIVRRHARRRLRCPRCGALNLLSPEVAELS